jgi:hypothetical protein
MDFFFFLCCYTEDFINKINFELIWSKSTVNFVYFLINNAHKNDFKKKNLEYHFEHLYHEKKIQINHLKHISFESTLITLTKIFKDYYLECLDEKHLLVYIEERDDLNVHYVHVNIELNQLVFLEHFHYKFHHWKLKKKKDKYSW